MRSLFALVTIATLMGAAAPTPAEAQGTPVYTELLDHYEAIRLALLAGTTDGTAAHAQAMATAAGSLHHEFDPARAGVKPEDSDECRALLAELERHATDLASVVSLQEAVEAFGRLSEPMVRLRNMVKDERSVVVYCSMVKRAWLQPEGEIGNPYAGKEMARCGEVISKR